MNIATEVPPEVPPGPSSNDAPLLPEESGAPSSAGHPLLDSLLAALLLDQALEEKQDTAPHEQGQAASA